MGEGKELSKILGIGAGIALGVGAIFTGVDYLWDISKTLEPWRVGALASICTVPIETLAGLIGVLSYIDKHPNHFWDGGY